MTPAGTRVTWFVLGVCVGVVLAVVGMAGIAEAAGVGFLRAPLVGHGIPVANSAKNSGGALILPLPASPGSGTAPAPGYGGNSEQAQAAIAASVRLTVQPAAVLPGPLISGEATWCAPTPRYCGNWGGDAMLGAVNSFRWGHEPYRVRVSRGSRSVVVRVVSFCACENRDDKIDLSPAAFTKLAPLPLGRIDVEVEVLP